MRTARSSSHPGGSPPGTPWEQPPPGEQTPLGAGPPGADTPPVDRITDACENITLPNFVAGGNKYKRFISGANYTK